MPNTQSNKSSERIHAITSDKVLQLKNNLAQIEFEHHQKKLLSESDFIEYLQTNYFNIEEYINKTYDYVEATQLSNRRFENLKRIVKKLIEMQVKVNNELTELSSSRNEELEEFYNEVGYEVFNSDLPPNPNYRQLEELKEYIAEIRKLSSLQNTNPPPKSYQDTIWFKTGLLFATGEMDKVIKKNNRNAAEIARAIENPKYEKYILATMNGYDTDKNIYLNNAKIQKIIDYCTKQNITITEEFKNKLSEE